MIWIGGLIGSILGKKAGIEEWWEGGRGSRVPDREETNRTGFCRVFFFFFWTGEIFVAGLGITSAVERSF